MLKFYPSCMRTIVETKNTQSPVNIKHYIWKKLFRINAKAYWPTHYTSMVTSAENILIGVDTAPGIMPGCYIQGGGKIKIGDYTQIAPNVGIISANHDVLDSRRHIESLVDIGKYCWIGMNSVVLPGVTLGDFTIVGAGSIVTKSFPEGYCVLAGNPAKKIKDLDKNNCLEFTNEHEYVGFIRKDIFYREKKKYFKGNE